VPIQRAPHVRIYERKGELNILDARGNLHRVTGKTARTAIDLLELLRTPRERVEIARTKSAKDVLAALEEVGVVGAPHAPPKSAEAFRVVLALAGGIAAAHAPALAEILLSAGFRVRVAATPRALRFVSEEALEALTHSPIGGKKPVPHLELARWAQVVVVWPATATTLSRIARGDCSTIVSAVAISARAPVVLVPAMNEAMLDAPAVRRNIAQLRDDGFILVHPSFGYEVANGPDDRPLAYGASPTVQSIAMIAEAVLRDH